MSKGETVFYTSRGHDYRATVKQVHRDGTVSVTATFALDASKKEVPGYLGFVFRFPASDLRSAA